jgi:hypothetical protein
MILRHLTRTELTWARDAFETIFPPRPGGACGIGAMDVEGYMTHTFARIPLEPALGIRLAIWIVALAPIFVLGRLRTIHRLSKDDRQRVLTRLTAHPVYAVRQLVLGLKAVAALLYAADPRVRATFTRAASPTIPMSRKPSRTPSAPSPQGGRRVAAA